MNMMSFVSVEIKCFVQLFGVLALAKQETCEVWGVELNPWLVAYSKFDAWRWNLSRYAKFKRTDLWKTNLDCYSGVVVFGTETLMPDLFMKIHNELDKDDFVVACRFPFNAWTPEQKFGRGIDTVWLYRITGSKIDR